MKTISIHSKYEISQEQLQFLKQVLQPGPILITTHDNPDPDALAAGKAINSLISG
jgi:nanoRNase/pAp phosphatase (c-di-AMP/oligoRNAs hydrolase)